ncbi:MAG: DDE-type integrase/transposase/recombinase [Planctomycetota bacterium]|jgi:transposase InsO family protein
MATGEEQSVEVEAAAIGDAAYAEAASGVELDASQIRSILGGPRKRSKPKALSPPAEDRKTVLTADQRFLILDLWLKSGLPAKDFGALVGISRHTLYKWKRHFEAEGPAGLVDKPKTVVRGSHLPEVTKRTILLMKETHPEWGSQRISDMLVRGPGYPASATAVAKLLHESGYESTQQPTTPHPDKPRRFERALPNQLWQTDIFSFVLKRQNRRVNLLAFMDDHSRFIVGYGIQASASTGMAIEVLEGAIASFQAPEELLTDNGPQYTTWRGKSRFSKTCEARGIKQIIAKPRRPQTLGKIERFWGTLWREFLEGAVFLDLDDARRRVGLFIDYYNFQRPHQGIEGLVPADRYFQAASAILVRLRKRLQENALTLARDGVPKQPFYLTGQVGGKPFSLHTEKDRMFLVQPDGTRQEVELVTPHNEREDGEQMDSVPGPGESVLEEGLQALTESLTKESEQEVDHD